MEASTVVPLVGMLVALGAYAFFIYVLPVFHNFKSVEVYDGEESVVLPCQISSRLPEVTKVLWSCSDLNQCIVHQHQHKDEPYVQNLRYIGRTSMSADALKTGDFSLTLKDPHLFDSGVYTCTVYDKLHLMTRIVVHLQVKVSKHASSVEVLEGMKAVVLPCWVPWFPEGTKVVWSHHGSNPSTVHQHQKQDEPYLQNQHFSGRTSMSDDALETGDFSLTLKEPHRSDSGLYLCTIRINENKIKMKWYQVQLQVTVPQHDSDVEVYEGVKSVVLPCQISSLPKYIKVVWSRFGFNPSTVHQHQDYAEPRFQNQLYSGRTLMSADALQTGDLSLTLKDPHLSDSGLYTCTVYSNEHIKRQTIVRLQVTVSQHASSVVVYEGIKSVMLPCQLPILPEGTKVMWSCSDLHPSTVHQHQDGDEPYLQNVFYSGRTSMSADALKTGNLSLTLKDPHYSDSGVYTCTIYSNEHIKRQISVHLQVTVSQHASNVVVYEGIKSFVLPCQLPWLPEGSLVVWSCPDLNPSTVHQHQDKDEPYLQNQLYNGRTSMSADALKTGDLGLTLKDPYHSDSGVYTCTVYSKGNMTGKKTVQLQVTESSTSSTRTDVLLAVVLAVLFLVLGLAVAVVLGLAVYFWYRIITVTWVEVEEEEMFVKLPCKTQAPLPECLSVEWSRCAPEPMKVHEYRNYTNNPVTQDEFYNDRTKMEIEKDPRKTGDFSLTLRYPCFRDSGTYICSVYLNRDIWMQKVVQLRVKVVDKVVEIGEWAKSVTLPFKTRAQLPEDATVEWSHLGGTHVTIHVYENGQDQLDKQSTMYRGRTKTKENPLQTGDLSLMMTNLTHNDHTSYVCTVCKDADIIWRRIVHLKVNRQ